MQGVQLTTDSQQREISPSGLLERASATLLSNALLYQIL